MKRKRFTEEQIIAVLKEHEAGAKTTDLARKHGISEATFYSAAFDESVNVELGGAISRGRPPWSNYIRGVAAGFQACKRIPVSASQTMTSGAPPRA